MTETKPIILVVEDEESIATMIRYNLEKEGFEVQLASDAETALDIIKDQTPDLILLDWMLPSISGVEMCEIVRKDQNNSALPIVMLTARGEEDDRIRGLEIGADDYIVKPFSPKVLVARIRAVLRRIRPAFSSSTLAYEGISIDLGAHKAFYDNKPIRLGPTEFKLLCHLVESPKHTFSREKLLDAVWGQDIYVESRTVDVHIRRLRKALSDCENGLDSYIKTIRSSGYMLEKE